MRDTKQIIQELIDFCTIYIGQHIHLTLSKRANLNYNSCKSNNKTVVHFKYDVMSLLCSYYKTG